MAEVVAYLQEIGYVNDRQFAFNYVVSQSFPSQQQLLLRMKLKNKGVADSIIDEVLNSEEMEYKLAFHLAAAR